jgi:chromosome segregation ATPase
MTTIDRTLSLYELETELVQAAQDAADGDENALTILDHYMEAGKDKRDRVASVLRSFDVQINAADEEIQRLKHRKEDLASQRAKLSSYVLSIMLQHQHSKLEGRLNTFSVAKNPPSVEIVDPAQVPGEYLEVRQEVHIRKSEIAKALKAGNSIPGTQLKKDSVRLEVR